MSSHQQLNKVVLQSVSAGDCEHCSTSFWESAVAPGRLRHSCASLSWTATPNWLSSKPTAATPFSIQVKLLLCLCVLILGCKPRTIKCTHCNCRLLSFTVLCSHWQVHCIRSEHEARSHIYRYVVSSVRSLEPKLIQVHWTSVQLHWAEHSEKVLNDTSQANQLFPLGESVNRIHTQRTRQLAISNTSAQLLLECLYCEMAAASVSLLLAAQTRESWHIHA